MQRPFQPSEPTMRRLLNIIVIGVGLFVSTTIQAQELSPETQIQTRLTQLKKLQKQGKCNQIKSLAMAFLSEPNATVPQQNEAIDILIQCKHNDLSTKTALNLPETSLAESTKHKDIELKTTHIVGWSIASSGASLAATAMIYVNVNVLTVVDANSSASIEDKRGALEARSRLRQIHWIIPTIYAISGVVTREGIPVMDQIQIGEEARLLPVWRSGGVGARLRIRF